MVNVFVGSYILINCVCGSVEYFFDNCFIWNFSLTTADVIAVSDCFFRYIMSFTDKKILRKPELDAFIAQAFSPELMNAHYLQELQVHFM